MRGAFRMGEKRWGLPVLVAGIIIAAIPLAASTLSMDWDRDFVARTSMPYYSRIRLPEPVAGPTEAKALSGEVAQAIAESVEAAAPSPTVPSRPQAPATESRPPPSAFIPIEFDILAPGAGDEAVGGEAIVVRKAVRMGQKNIGSLPIHVDGGSRLLVDASEVRSLLDDADIPGTVRGSGLVSLADLRKAGIDLRYDPSSDSVLLATR